MNWRDTEIIYIEFCAMLKIVKVWSQHFANSCITKSRKFLKNTLCELNYQQFLTVISFHQLSL